MERIIKFRAWDLKKNQFFKEWFSISSIGDTIYDSDGFSCIIGKDVLIQQFTGLYDKNGKEIYEGDILEWRRYRFEVRFNNGEYYGYPFSNNEIPGDLSCGHFYESEIIGNVFQNSELLND